MMNDHFRQAILELDVALARKIWAHVAPHLPQAKTDAEALATLHMARTQLPTAPERLRFYSHRWLLNHALPSQLPDELRPSAERMYPKIVDGVGIAVKSFTPGLMPLIRGAMEDAVNDCYAEGNTEPSFVKARMLEARAKEKRKLFGPTGK